MTAIDVTTVTAGPNADALVHARVFGRTDEAPPYSTDRRVAEWLAGEYGLRVIPVHDLSSVGPRHDPASEVGAVGFVAARQVPVKGDGSPSDGIEFFGSADSFELAVTRAVLVIAGAAFGPRDAEYY